MPHRPQRFHADWPQVLEVYYLKRKKTSQGMTCTSHGCLLVYVFITIVWILFFKARFAWCLCNILL